jgi:hypothetical protein
MSKKHFQALAAEICKLPNATSRRDAAVAVARAVAQFNAKFDVERFYKACRI